MGVLKDSLRLDMLIHGIFLTELRFWCSKCHIVKVQLRVGLMCFVDITTDIHGIYEVLVIPALNRSLAVIVIP